jgi:hypothetical protein
MLQYRILFRLENEHLKPYKNNFIIFLGEISVTVHILFQIENIYIYIRLKIQDFIQIKYMHVFFFSKIKCFNLLDMEYILVN